MSLSVLVVDDEEMTRNLLRLMLSRSRYTVLEAGGGYEALEMVQAHKPDLVILDLMMPDLDGFSVCERIRKDPETANIPIFILSARADHETIARGLELGATKYLTKPVGYKDLLAHIQDVFVSQT
ncbi:MAG: response regulator [Chloroflexi bacterium]|nr:response regulator [Chloroflexota bacterium]